MCETGIGHHLDIMAEGSRLFKQLQKFKSSRKKHSLDSNIKDPGINTSIDEDKNNKKYEDIIIPSPFKTGNGTVRTNEGNDTCNDSTKQNPPGRSLSLPQYAQHNQPLKGSKSSLDVRQRSATDGQRPKDSQRVSMYQESMTSIDLIGHASLSAKDVLFGLPPTPVRPPRLSILRPGHGVGSRSQPGTPDSIQQRRSRAADALQAMKRLSVVSKSESEGNETESEDSYMDWSDDETSVSSPTTSPSSSPCPKQDIYEDVDFPSPGKDKAFLIAKELMTSEEHYVKKLEVLNKARNKTIEIAGNDVAKEMFPYINSIYTLHKDNMLPHLKERLKNWNQNRQIGDIMKTFTPFLKIYADYVNNFANALKLVDAWNTKNADFSKMLRLLPTNGPVLYSRSMNLKLQIKSQMLEPVQRVPRYQLLLQQYSKEIRPDAAERADLQVALTSVTQAAKHFEEWMKHGSMKGELLEIQRQVDSPISLISTGRELIKQGKINKVHAKNGKVVSRYLFLFNDLFLVCAEQTFPIPGLFPKYKVKHLMEVEGMQIGDGDNFDVPHTFYVKTRKKAIELCASDEDEKCDWQQVLWKAVGDKMRLKLSTVPARNRRQTMMLRADGPLGKEAPVWVHNTQVTMCMMCAANFKGLKKKHHCRACGAVVCNRCSSHTSQLEYDDMGAHRVCDECYMVLEDAAMTVKRESIIKSRNRELCTYSGHLHVSSDFGKTWERRWFEVQEGGQFYCYKAQQDICPISYLQLSECTCDICIMEGVTNVKVIRIQTTSEKSYFFKEEDTEKLGRWIEALEMKT